MLNSDLQQFIKDLCMTIKGGLNNRTCIKSWWENKGLICIYNAIMNNTEFLKEGSQFSERLYHICNNSKSKPTCHNCANHTNFNTFQSGYYNYCSVICQAKCPDRNLKRTTNTDYASMVKTTRKSNMNKYGVEFSTQTDMMKFKTKVTKLAKYGDERYNNSAQKKKTNLERYGYESFFASVEGKRIVAESHQRIYGKPISQVVHNITTEQSNKLSDPSWLLQENQTKSIIQISEEIGVTPRAIWCRFKQFDIPVILYPPKNMGGSSKLEKEIYEYLQTLDLTVVYRDRNTIKPRELDFAFHNQKLAIEIDGIYWHSNDFQETPKDRLHHYEKRKMAEQLGYRFIAITDDQWNTKQSICKNIIENTLRINTSKSIRASSCRIDAISSNKSNTFLDQYHIQGSINSSIRFGLYYGDELVSVACFGKSRFSNIAELELLRFCTIPNYRIHGSLSKILKQFSGQSIVSYSNCALFSGMTYERCGFKLVSENDPGYFYYKGGRILSRQSAQKHKLEGFLNTFDPNLTESENMFNNGYRRYWDYGSKTWLLSP